MNHNHNAGRCIRCRRPSRATHGQLCSGHYEQLRDDLRDITQLLDLIEDMTVPGPGIHDSNYRGKPIHSKAPVVLSAVAATDWRTKPDNGDRLVSVTSIIIHWSTCLTQHRQLVTTESTASQLTQIATHLDWFSNQPDLATFAQDIHDAAHMLRNIAGEVRPPIGRHKAAHPNKPDTDCGGRLYPLPHTFGVWCIDCGETYDGHAELRRLGLVLNDDTPKHKDA